MLFKLQVPYFKIKNIINFMIGDFKMNLKSTWSQNKNNHSKNKLTRISIMIIIIITIDNFL